MAIANSELRIAKREKGAAASFNHSPLAIRVASVLGRPGGTSGEPVPDPIPNSAVKLPSANGTKSQDLEEEVAARPAKDRYLFMLLHERCCAKRRHTKPPRSSVAAF